jgi:hypothetical protein
MGETSFDSQSDSGEDSLSFLSPVMEWLDHSLFFMDIFEDVCVSHVH